jgi:DNA-binding XRE family transcriptional regulator
MAIAECYSSTTMVEEEATPGEGATLPGDVPSLRQLRRLKGWTQRELARQAGVTEQTVVRLEAGQGTPRVSTMRAIADALGVPIRQVDEFREERPRPPG